VSGRPAGLLVLAALALGLGGCAGNPAPKDFRQTTISTNVEPFQDVRSNLVKLARAREAKDAATARAMWGETLASSKRALLMGPPNDLSRENVARFLEGRARFSDALNAYGRAQAGSDDAALWTSTKELEDAFWAWYDAYRGKPSEGSV
jgi:hypothetical protein